MQKLVPEPQNEWYVAHLDNMVIAIKKVYDLCFEKYADGKKKIYRTLSINQIFNVGQKKSMESVARIAPSKKDKVDDLNFY